MPEQPTSVGMERKLAAIFSTDVAGYSRLMGDDEEATIRTLTASRAVISSLIQQYRGRVVDAPGDNLLAEFASVVDAVRCAVEMQHALTEQNAELPDHRQMRFRIGINLGDVIVEGERLYGDGVNIAARLESLAEPGGICISGTVHDHIKNKLALAYEDLGPQAVKNIAEPVRVFRIVMDAAKDSASQKSKVKGQKSKVEDSRAGFARRKGAMVAVAGVVLLTATFVTARYLSSPSPNSALSPPPSPLLPLPAKPSLVVLPFVNMSGDAEQEYFSDGLTEALTGDLSKISSLFVIARNSAFTYKGKAVKVQDVGREMGVRYVLEGSVQKADQQVRITAQLIEATTGYHLWSEQYDRPLKDIFALQDEIVQRIVTTLKLQLTLQEQGYVVRKHTDNLEAYDAFLRGVADFWRLTQDANLTARQLFEQAVALDPQYAEAYAWLGWTYWAEEAMHWSPGPQTLERALTLERKALMFDDSLSVAHSVLSQMYTRRQQYDQAIAEGERAVALDPNNADSYVMQADMLNFAGRPEEALQAVAQAMRLNPRYPPFYLWVLGWAYNLTGRYTEAIVTLQEASSRSPTLFIPPLVLSDSYLWQWSSQQTPGAQTLEPAVAAAQRAIALNESAPGGPVSLGHVRLWQKQYELAIVAMTQAITLDPHNAYGYAGLAVVLSYVGRLGEAVGMAEQALRFQPDVVDGHLASVGTAYALAGRYEEARDPLQRYLSRYPNILPIHLTLAAVYSELGQAAEARAEVAEVLRLNPKFSLEIHKQRVPIKDPAVLERHIAALRKAGLK